jgi:Uma2 family endonuclease
MALTSTRLTADEYFALPPTEQRVYAELGLAELWLVDTAADEVLVYRRSGPEAADFDVELEFDAGESLTTPLIPGFILDVAALFDR